MYYANGLLKQRELLISTYKDCVCSHYILDLDEGTINIIESEAYKKFLEPCGKNFNLKDKIVLKTIRPNKDRKYEKFVIEPYNNTSYSISATNTNVYTYYEDKVIFDCRSVTPLRSDHSLLLLKLVGYGSIVVLAEDLKNMENAFSISDLANVNLKPGYIYETYKETKTLYKFAGKYYTYDVENNKYIVEPYVNKKALPKIERGGFNETNNTDCDSQIKKF